MVQQGQTIELTRRGPGDERLWAYRYRTGGRGSKRVQRGGFASQQDARDACGSQKLARSFCAAARRAKTGSRRRVSRGIGSTDAYSPSAP
jgi:hypothetical protein